MTPEEVQALFDESRQRTQDRAESMPTERAALKQILEAIERLKDLGWNNIEYCPKDGSIFDAIELGSTGIHKCRYEGKWPKGRWWIEADGDMWPSRSILFRKIPSQD